MPFIESITLLSAIRVIKTKLDFPNEPPPTVQFPNKGRGWELLFCLRVDIVCLFVCVHTTVTGCGVCVWGGATCGSAGDWWHQARASAAALL